ncbi:uncharacterized protein [Dysidea avara]|uniref:uncharacterized protein n=1 Tax=Dysidea avara TaxID=196820 RepID=UPI00331809DA
MSPGIMHSSVSSFSPSQSSSRHHSSSTPPHGSSVSLFPSQKIKTSKPDSMDDMSAKSMPSLEETMETTPNATVTMPVPNYSTMPGLHTQKQTAHLHPLSKTIERHSQQEITAAAAATTTSTAATTTTTAAAIDPKIYTYDHEPHRHTYQRLFKHQETTV